MIRWLSRLLVVAVLAVAAVAFTYAGTQDKTPDIKDVMGKLHKGSDGLRARLGRSIKLDSPDWDTLQRETKEFTRLAEALGKNTPPKGDKTSWEKLVKEFTIQAKEMEKAAESKNKADLQAVHAKMGNCKPCHSAHRP